MCATLHCIMEVKRNTIGIKQLKGPSKHIILFKDTSELFDLLFSSIN